ncbi:hypothetical protein [Fusobacterium periodonticum]|uniref:DUF4376 domain-containing protein n=1 Tax=Fusobacterium periodonticum ATCC 33693 TaxID=546275 RepID=D4CXR5_9FUSO|nr:hypothetical protein [Fusobacterium periodonticum]EFE85904.1 hypothetical protein FUSPEROL_02262 [Fusobacterium periodonticum ATCC 33693]
MFYYIDKEEAKKGNSLVLAVTNEQYNDYKQRFNDKAIEFQGENLPFYITYNEITNTIREATELEKIDRGQLKLDENQVIINNKIITYNKDFQKIISEKIVNKELKELLETNILTIEEIKTKKIEEIKKTRDEFINSDLELDGCLIQVRDQEDRDKFNRIILGLLLGQLRKEDKEEWRLSDNSYMSFTYSKLAEIPTIYSNRERDAFKKFHILEEKLKKAKTINEIEEISW